MIKGQEKSLKGKSERRRVEEIESERQEKEEERKGTGEKG